MTPALAVLCVVLTVKWLLEKSRRKAIEDRWSEARAWQEKADRRWPKR